MYREGGGIEGERIYDSIYILNKVKRNYLGTEIDCLAVMWGI
jgi:hypothetical protein